MLSAKKCLVCENKTNSLKLSICCLNINECYTEHRIFKKKFNAINMSSAIMWKIC